MIEHKKYTKEECIEYSKQAKRKKTVSRKTSSSSPFPRNTFLNSHPFAAALPLVFALRMLENANKAIKRRIRSPFQDSIKYPMNQGTDSRAGTAEINLY